MAVLNIPDQNKSIRDVAEIRAFLNARGVFFDQWEAAVQFSPEADQETILNAYAHALKPLMEKGGYQTADVLNINAHTPNYTALREKFLHEHTHTEDEVRFFVEGSGLFWFNLDNGQDPVFNVLCEAGDLISVPAHTKHWFDAGVTNPNVKAIRIFIDQSGWVPHYTESGVDTRYNPA
ncbi:1,2-dihydroxy-3-keto-5-methylthiopentene dioxygenase [Eisenibacter elegans]|jgi:1,2-dihydroxy-3-keto-5-methylthiopentene dioxygenase|uniref:1,2-dihydroxy-3-keto-5-methylthiopentene dioxygenase n=1 Tax=Eisenibacter elegans TaxID=997 RepID=UPI0004262372|nr:cupin [Eisenibacter elegans]